jgi:hypothetical protein
MCEIMTGADDVATTTRMLAQSLASESPPSTASRIGGQGTWSATRSKLADELVAAGFVHGFCSNERAS